MPGETTRAERRHAAMMSRGAAQPVTLRAGEQRSAGEVRVERWDGSARLVRAAKSWALLWALAVVSILVPVAHFVLVPAFLLAGPIAGVARYRQRSGVLGGEATCPSCGARMIIEARADRWPFLEHCEACGRAVWVERTERGTQGSGG